MQYPTWEYLCTLLGLELQVHPKVPSGPQSTFLGDVGYLEGVIYVEDGLLEPWIPHEIAHWLVATKKQRATKNYGLGIMHGPYAIEIEERAADLGIGLWSLYGNVAAHSVRDLTEHLGAEDSDVGPMRDTAYQALLAHLGPDKLDQWEQHVGVNPIDMEGAI